MRPLRLVLPLLVFAPLVCAQGVYEMTITESRTINVQPDQAVFNLTLIAPVTGGLDDALAPLAALGITAANLVSVYGTTQDLSGRTTEQVLQWGFTLSVPIAKLKDNAASLAALQRQLAASRSGPALNFSSGTPQVSPQLQASQTCPIPDLVADARAQALKLATANGFTLGPIVAMSDGTSGGATPGQNSAIPRFLFLTGVIGIGSLYSVSAPSPPPCILVAKFNMFRY